MIPSSQTIHYAHEEKYPGRVSQVTHNDQVIVFNTDNQCSLKIEILSNKIIRIRYSVRPFFTDNFSYAIDPNFKKEPTAYSIVETGESIIINTDLLTIHVVKFQLFVHIYDQKGQLLNSDEKGFHWEENHQYGGEIVKMSKTAFVDEAFYGLGDKTADQNIRGRRFENWGSDEFGYTAASDPLYKNINLYYSFHQGKTYGIYFDNSFRTYYDICHLRQEVVSFWAEGGEMDYYFFYGDDLLDVSAQYAKLTGVAEMPPLWALGYQQSKWSYYPEQQVKEIASKLREAAIPCDAIYLDIDYMDGFRCFTWDHERFPDPKKMIRELRESGFKTVAIIDPGIKIDFDYDVFKSGLEKDYFCKRSDGPYMQGKVWPGECYFPDFTDPEVRDWWSSLFRELIGEIGLSGIWNDMNEPAIFDVPTKTFPLDVRHDYEGNPCSHRKAHNVYGMQMARASAEGFRRFAGNKRPFIITRSGFAGMQRFSSTWTGDNLANWEHLKFAHLQTLRLSISGVSFCGSDIGGFIDRPTPELFVRWYQLAIFHPFFRNHSSGDHGDQEPWSFGEKALKLVKSAVELRYQLLPYLYTCFYDHYSTGKPILRPFIFNKDSSRPFRLNDNETGFLGDHLLYSPVFKEGIKEKNVFLPEGTWYDFDSLESHRGNKTIKIATPLSKIPIFIRAGAVLPLYPIMQHVGEREIKEVELKVFAGKGQEQSQFYCDAGDGNDYKQGIFRLAHFKTEGSYDSFIIEQRVSGAFQPTFSKYRLSIIGLSASLHQVWIDGKRVENLEFSSENTLALTADIDFQNITIQF